MICGVYEVVVEVDDVVVVVVDVVEFVFVFVDDDVGDVFVVGGCFRKKIGYELVVFEVVSLSCLRLWW